MRRAARVMVLTGLALLAALSIGGAAYWRLRAQRQN